MPIAFPDISQHLHMLFNSASKETIAPHVIFPEPTTFHFGWTKLQEYDLADKLHSPQYANLNVVAPTSSTPDTMISKPLKVPKPEPKEINHCSFCKFAIVDKEISVLEGKYYHHRCLRCAMCDMTFDFNDKCYVRDGSFLCRADHAKRYQKCCRKCEQPLNREDMVMRAKEMIYHNSCFVCFLCTKKLNTGDFYTVSPEGHLYCQAHYAVPTQVLLEEPKPTTVSAIASPPKTTPPTAVILPLSSTSPAPEAPAREPSTEAEASTDEDGSSNGHQRNKRMRTSFKHHQLRAMKSYFALNHNPDAKDLKQLAVKTNLTKRVLQVWFQNARAKFRRGLQDGGRPGSPMLVIHSTLEMNPPLSTSSSNHSTDGFPSLSSPPLTTEIYSPNANYTHL
ncbi:unnamed protein product [Caenorhabditis nigoni]